MEVRSTIIRQQTNKEKNYNSPSLSWTKNIITIATSACALAIKRSWIASNLKPRTSILKPRFLNNPPKKFLTWVKAQIESWTNDLDQFINFDRSWILDQAKKTDDHLNTTCNGVHQLRREKTTCFLLLIGAKIIYNKLRNLKNGAIIIKIPQLITILY